MQETTTSIESETQPHDRARMVPAVVHLALDAVDRGQATAIAVLQDARIELRVAVDGGLDYAEKLAASALRFTRNLVQKLDEAGQEALTGAERAAGNALASARKTTDAADELARKTTDAASDLARKTTDAASELATAAAAKVSGKPAAAA